jgi:acyl-homoserine lactone acylase PvdQ
MIRPTEEFTGQVIERKLAIDWLNGVKSSEDGRGRALTTTLAATIDYLKHRYGENEVGWAWGEVHRVLLKHPLS